MGASARMLRTPVIAVAGAILGLGLLSLLLPSSATYDPWSWINWGRQIVHGDLNTVDGPSWKPLPAIVTTLAAPFGRAAPDIWVLVARMGALTGVAMAFVVARRLAGTAAGLAAGAALLLAPWWVWNGWLANSEGLLVAFVLGAVWAELTGRRRLAFACGVAAGLLRPEVWPFLVLYAIWIGRRADRRGRIAMAVVVVLLAPAWLLPEKWGSGDFWRAASRAQNPDPGAASLTAHPWWTVLKDFVGMLPRPVWAMVAVAVVVLAIVVVGRLRRAPTSTAAASPAAPSEVTSSAAAPPAGPPSASPRSDGLTASPRVAVLAIALFGLAWLVVVMAMTERGFSGNERYLMPPAALLVVAGAGGFGLLLPRAPAAARWALLAVVAITIVVSAVEQVPDQLRSALYESKMVDDLPNAIALAGGAARLRSCAPAATHKFMVPQTAWALDEHASAISMTPVDVGPYVVVLRMKLIRGGGLTPTVKQIPDLRTLAVTKYWQIVARCRPMTKQVTR